ncbi:DUF3718 domain-containing protein [Alteromonas facilis]|uniref:DUF3718 domain-containing protein n=1 Tax=Alteromonas facilis TaxID=2048004 RepID=UPI000C2900E5|nr:DUF3718 domain-containing protein [Alteromonas facilis]
MKALIKPTLIGISMAASVVSAPAWAEMDKQSEKVAVRLCENIKYSSKFELRRILKRYRLSVRTINEKLVCNGLTPIEFASLNSNNETLALLNKDKTNSSLAMVKKQ